MSQVCPNCGEQFEEKVNLSASTSQEHGEEIDVSDYTKICQLGEPVQHQDHVRYNYWGYMHK